MGKRNPYIYPFPYPFWLRTVYRRHIHSCLFFFFILGPNDGDFIGRGSWNKKKKQEAKSNERKTGNLHLGCKAHFAKCRQRLFILYTLHISTAPPKNKSPVSRLVDSLSQFLRICIIFFFFLATLWHLVRTQTDTLVLLHGRHVALLFFSYLISICAVLLLWYPKRRRSDSQRWRRVQCVTLATVLKYNKQQESI